MPKGQYPRKSHSLVERYWGKVIVKKGCWGWKGSFHPDGYGYLTVRKRLENNYRKNFYAHRISWEVHCGPIPEGLFVLHKCDNPPCTNPKHLFLGTNKDNMDDCSAKGRQNGKAKALPGSQNPMAIFDERDIPIIRKSTKTISAIADLYGVSKSAIALIRQRKSWKHVP
jgi:HNH endonuclease